MSDARPRPEAVEFDPNASESARVPSEPSVSDSPTLPLEGALPPSQQETRQMRGALSPPRIEAVEFTPADSSATLQARPPSTDHRISRVVHAIKRPKGAKGALGVEGYSLSDELGRGAQGIVYRATPEAGGADVAIKILRPEASEAQLERFERAIDAMETLRGVTGVVQLLARGRTRSDAPFFAMQLVHGPSLREVLNKGRVTPPDLVRMLAQVAYALHAAHDRGIVHRDLKPENILIEIGSGEMQPLVADFGLARDVRQAAPRSTAGGLGGTPNYMAPEQVSGEAITRRTDIHALGAILYEIIMGAPPFQNPNVATTVHAIATQAARRPRVRWTRLPPALEAITLQALSKNPDDRHVTAALFAQQVLGALEGDEIEAVPTRRVRLRQPGHLRARAGAALARRGAFFKGLALGVTLGAALGGWAGGYW